MISFIPANARSAPGISATRRAARQAEEPRPGSITARGKRRHREREPAGARAPPRAGLRPPMFHEFHREARATASPARISGIALINVCSIANDDPSARSSSPDTRPAHRAPSTPETPRRSGTRRRSRPREYRRPRATPARRAPCPRAAPGWRPRSRPSGRRAPAINRPISSRVTLPTGRTPATAAAVEDSQAVATEAAHSSSPRRGRSRIPLPGARTARRCRAPPGGIDVQAAESDTWRSGPVVRPGLPPGAGAAGFRPRAGESARPRSASRPGRRPRGHAPSRAPPPSSRAAHGQRGHAVVMQHGALGDGEGRDQPSPSLSSGT